MTKDNVSFEQALALCLQELDRTGDVAACLGRYPEYADRLRPLLEIAQHTRRYYSEMQVPNPPGKLQAGRARLLAAAAELRAQDTPVQTEAGVTGGRWFGPRLIWATRFVGMLMIVVVMLSVIGGGVVWAANDSLPGDALYPVKLMVEDTRLALASTPDEHVALALAFVDERADEVQALTAEGSSAPDDTIARMERHVERALVHAAGASDEQMVRLLRRIAQTTRAQSQALERAATEIPEPVRPGLERAANVCRWGAEAAENGLDDPAAFRRRYRRPGESGTPMGTLEPRGGSVTPAGEPKLNRERHQHHGQEGENAPARTPQATPQTTRPVRVQQTMPSPQGPQATPKLPGAPGPQSTTVPAPGKTPLGRAVTPGPQPTPQPQPAGPQPTKAPGPSNSSPGQATSESQATSQPQSKDPRPTTAPGPAGTPSSSHK